jgi:hypothetical protein
MGTQVQLSPGIVTREVDLTGYVPATSASEGAFAGVFRWGPVEKRILIDSEQSLATRFGKPSIFNYETWFSAMNFLSYTDKLWISRAADTTGNNATKSYVGNSTNLVIESGNNVLVLANSTVGNTTDLAVGMVLFYTNASAIPTGATIASVNSTAVVLSDTATANVEAAEIVFRENIAYAAVALQADLNYDATDVSDWDEQTIKNDDHYSAREANGDSFDSAVLFVARYPGDIGNSLRVSVCDSPAQFKSNTTLAVNAHINATATALVGNVGSNTLTITIAPANTANVTQVTTANAHADTVRSLVSVGDLIEIGNTRLGFQFLTVTAISTLGQTSNVFSFTLTCDDEVKLSTNTNNSYLSRYWEFYNAVDVVPGQSDYVLQFGNTSANDELHVVVVDELGKFTGSPGTILERYANLSRATNAKSQQGNAIYYKEVINQSSPYIWFANDRTTAPSNTAELISSSLASKPLSMTMIGGADGPDESNVPFGTLAFAWDMFQSTEESDIGLVIQGKARGEAVSHYTQLGNYLIDNIAEVRQDCVAFISPDKADVVSNTYEEANDLVEFRNNLRNTSYAVLDSGYKYQYDKYNDQYRWVPLCGDIAGLCARVDRTNDPWWSPAGINRGNIKNVLRLAYNPRQSDRDILYKNNINPVVSEAGFGTYLNGDKTLLEKPSAFDRINVRRLFITIRKAIKKASKTFLYEFNDDFTRAQWRNLVNPYLRDVKGRRGITDFLVVCDATNNTPEVIDRNEFVGDIYIKPARAINFITLNFVAVKTGVSFSEVVGKF